MLRGVLQPISAFVPVPVTGPEVLTDLARSLQYEYRMDTEMFGEQESKSQPMPC